MVEVRKPFQITLLVSWKVFDCGSVLEDVWRITPSNMQGTQKGGRNSSLAGPCFSHASRTRLVDY
jgi:hypothetical protein